jgi:hypothetical protein
MEETNTNKARILNIVFSVLLFGGLWGIVEATLGTLLHMPFIHRTMFLSSTTILVPIAYFLMGACYKKTGTFRSVLYMGLFAAAIKAISCAIFKMSFNPVFYMLIEALAMGTALLVIRPKQIISFAGLGAMIMANFIYLGASTFLRMNVLTSTPAQVLANVETYVFKFNCVAILYTFAFGAVLFGVIKLAEVRNWNFDSIKKVIFHPAFAGSMAAIALVVTLVLR